LGLVFLNLINEGIAIEIRILAISSIPLIEKKIGLPTLSRLIFEAINRQANLSNGDIIIIAQTIISKAEGRIFDLNEFKVTSEAEKLAKELKKDPRLIAAILSESKQVLKKTDKSLIVELNSGLICANAGVDQSNSGKNKVTLLPKDPDGSALTIKKEIKKISGKSVGIIISDTQGRVLREGAVNIGLGFSGFKNGILHYEGKTDLFGFKLKTTEINIIDELASAAELLMGEANEGIPVVLIKGYNFEPGYDSSKSLIRNRNNQLFK